MSPDEIEIFILSNDIRTTIAYLMDENFLQKEAFCLQCFKPMNLVEYRRNIDKYAWRCMFKTCNQYKKYISIRTNSFFSAFKIELKQILRTIIRYACSTQRYSINLSLDINEKTIRKIIDALIERIPSTDFSDNKLGGPGLRVEIDETMLNYKCKSHRGRSAANHTDALCIVEASEGAKRVFACTINDKKASTLIPIICRNVANNTIIWTDEHRSYSSLSNYTFLHETVCHKYEFITENGVNTQKVESFNNSIKLEIKKRKGVLTTKRDAFLKEFCFIQNNKTNLLNALFYLIKI